MAQGNSAYADSLFGGHLWFVDHFYINEQLSSTCLLCWEKTLRLTMVQYAFFVAKGWFLKAIRKFRKPRMG